MIEKMREWCHARYYKSGEKPERVPLTRAEIQEITSDLPYQCFEPTPEQGRRFMGVDVFETPYAEEIRARTINLDMQPIRESAEIDLTFTKEEWSNDITDRICRRITTQVATDTTKVSVTLEWDAWAGFKRALRITRWFPIKKRTVEIDGRVLYPYLKVSLPTNRHHVQFAVR